MEKLRTLDTKSDLNARMLKVKDELEYEPCIRGISSDADVLTILRII
jgi:hypothetical protein